MCQMSYAQMEMGNEMGLQAMAGNGHRLTEDSNLDRVGRTGHLDPDGAREGLGKPTALPAVCPDAWLRIRPGSDQEHI